MKNIALITAVTCIMALNSVSASNLTLAADTTNYQEETITIARGTNIALCLPESISSADVNRGDVVQLEVYLDIKVEGETVIKTGDYASGTVRKVKKAKKFGGGGKLILEGLHVRTKDGQIILLDGGVIIRDGKSRRTLAWSMSAAPTAICIAVAAASGPGILAAAPIFIAQGLLIKGTEVTIEEGTLMHARILKDVKIRP